MPDDPIVNDHYGDILWRLDRKIQARYFWRMVQNMENVDEEVLKKINIKLIEGLKTPKMAANKIKSHAKINLVLNITGKGFFTSQN